MEDKSSGDKTYISSPAELMSTNTETLKKKKIEVHGTMKIIDRVEENVRVQITRSQARRMRLLEETGSKRFRLEHDMTVHMQAELEALYKKCRTISKP
jgi:hypothetical protein